MGITPLVGHTTRETAYLVDDYPYGFRLRCKIRYWLEYKQRKGFRLVSQTSNPKIPGVWNKPKASTYSALAVMGLDEQGHVTWVGVGLYDIPKLQDFITMYGGIFDGNQKTVADTLLAAYARHRKAHEGTL